MVSRAVFGAVLVVMLAACGNPEPRHPFTFTPMPYTVQPGLPAVSLDKERCYFYVADEVVVLLTPSARGSFTTWAESNGFAITTDVHDDRLEFVTLGLKVPLGAVDDAREVIRQQPGVHNAERNPLLSAPEAPTPVGCTAAGAP